jgi:hypothetical protein
MMTIQFCAPTLKTSTFDFLTKDRVTQRREIKIYTRRITSRNDFVTLNSNINMLEEEEEEEEENKQLVSSFKNSNNFQTKVPSFQTNQNHKKQRKTHKNEHDAQLQNKIPIPLKNKLLKSRNE